METMDINKPPTPRQREAILLAGQGLSNQEIAEQMCLTVDAVTQHISDGAARLNLPYHGRNITRRWAYERLLQEENRDERNVLHRSYAPCFLGGI